MNEMWILGATGRTGRAIAAQRLGLQVPLGSSSSKCRHRRLEWSYPPRVEMLLLFPQAAAYAHQRWLTTGSARDR
jgi:hypothetical protein